MQGKRIATPPGIQLIHSRFCPSRSGGDCTAGKRDGCRPSYRAMVYDRKKGEHKGTKVKKTFPTLAAAKAWRAEATHRVVNQKRRLAESTITLNEAAEAWLAGARTTPPTVLTRSGRAYKPAVLRTYNRDLDNYVLPQLGVHRLSEIGRGDLKRLVDRLVGAGLSPSKVRNVINPVRAIYREAVEAEEVQTNPTTGLRLPAMPKPAVRAVEPTELLTFLASLSADDAALYATAAYAGLRRGELRGLRWSDVELRDGPGPHAGWINVNRSWDDVEGEIEPKSEAGRRPVPIVRPYLSEQLEALRERTSRSGSDFVFGQAAATPFEPSQVLRRIAGRVEAVNVERHKAELDPIRKLDLHALRHTYGAMIRRAGVPEDDREEYLGHARPSVTDRYTSPIEADAFALDNMTKLATYIARGDTASRLAQLDERDETADQLLAAFAGDPDGFEQFVADLRAQLGAD